MNHDTRASAGYHLAGIAHHDTLRASFEPLKTFEPEWYGGLRLASAVLLMGAGAVATLWVVGVAKLVWAVWGFG